MLAQRLNISLIGIFLFIILVTTSTTGAASSCKRGCPESDNGYLLYKPGNVYEYNFDSIMTVGVNGGAKNSDDTSLKLAGNAKLFAEGNCGYTLQLSAVKVTATKENIEKKILQSIQNPVHFTMVDGKVEPELCVDQSDTAYALNVKRAIISMLQSKPDAVQEVDIFGQCNTHTSVTKIGDVEVVNKVRNLNACGYRKIINSGILINAVQTKSNLEDTSVLKADYTKESKIDKGIISNVQVVEEYKYDAISKSDVGISAKVLTNLKLRNLSGAPSPAPETGSHAASIIFQQPETYINKNFAALKTALTELVQQLSGYVQKDSAKSFMELIRLMRNSDTDTLLELGAFPLPNKVLARKVYLDALFRTATSESARAILKQFNKMNEKEKTVALLSLNLVQSVDKDTLNQANALINPNSIKEAYLAVGSLVNKYCDRNGCNNGEIENISKKFTDSLKHCKANTKKDEERILYVLKGITNANHLSSSVVASLSECVATGRSNRIRVAALQAFSATGCDANLQSKALDLLADRNEDSELRIEAYLALIQCPSGELANKIAEIVNSETVNQVGRFITSNLRAIRDSVDKSKDLQRHCFGNIRVTKVFPKDFRRYSFNNEVSYKMEALGLSASADYKLIYSQTGFLPRTASLNVKAEKFGINMDILDISIRQDNLENVLEYFLGPKGLVNKDLGEILVKTDDTNGGRSRRSIADDTSKVSKKYKAYGGKHMNDLNLDLSLKMFGSEMLFLSLGDNIPSTFDEITKEFTEAYDKVKKKLNNYNKEFISHNFFMDTETLYPTGVGIPLELVAHGFVANKMDFGVSVDVDSLMQSNWYNTKYRLKFVPSMDVNVHLKFGFNAYVLSSGLQSVFSMHTATGSSVDVAIINEGSGFDMNIELPRKKMELIDLKMQNNFYVAEQDKTIKSVSLKGVKPTNDGPSIESCYNQFESLGFSPCIVGSFSDLKQEDGLSQPFDFTVYVITERNFNLKGYHKQDEQVGLQQWKLEYSTPNSKESHDASLTFELGTKPRAYARVYLDNANYHFAVEGGLNNDSKEMVLYALYEQERSVKKSKIGFIKNGNEYRPVIEVVDANGVISNDIGGYRVDGRVVVQDSGDQHILQFENLQVSNKESDRIVVNGWANLESSSFSSELHLDQNENSFLIKNNLKVTGGEYSFGFFINEKKLPEDVYGGSTKIVLADQLISVNLLGQFAKWEASTSTEVQYAKQEGSDSVASSKFLSSLNVKHKQNNVGSLKIQGLTEGQNKFEVNVDGTSNKKVAAVSVKYASSQNAPNDYQISVNLKLNQHFIDIASKCDVVGNHFILDNVLTTSWGSALTLKGELGQRYTPQDIYIDLKGSAQFSGKYKQVHWILKVIGTPEKTNSEFKVLRDNNEVIRLSVDTQHPQDKITSGKAFLSVKNVITAKGDFKMIKNGKGEVSAVFETLKAEPKHKAEINSKFHIQHPKYDVEATVVLDGEQKFYVKSENILDKLKLNSKNVVDVAQKKILFDANSLIKGDWRVNGEMQGSFTAVCPDGRTISGSLKRKITTNSKTGIAQGHVDIQLADQWPNEGGKRSLTLSGKVDKYSVKAKELSATSQLIYTNFEGQTLNVDWHIKKLPKNQYKMIDFGISVKGPLTKPIEVKLNVDEYSPRHGILNIDGKYDDIFKGNVKGNFELSERGTPLKYEIHINADLPQTALKTITFKSNGQFLKPETEGGKYILELFVEEKSGNGQFTKFNSILQKSEQSGAFKINLETHSFEAPLEIDGSYLRDHQGSFKEDNAHGSVKYDFNFKYAEKFLKSSNILQYKDKESTTNHFTVSSSFEGAKNIDVEVNGKLLDPESYNINVKFNHNEHTYTLDSTAYRGNHKKGAKIAVSLPNKTPINVVAVFEAIGPRKSKVTVEILNVVDFDFNLNGEASYNAIDNFYIVAQWSSQKLKLDNYVLDVRTQDKSLSMVLKNAQGEIFSGSVTCALKKENNKVVLEGQGQIKYKGNAENTNFRLTRQVYELATDNEVGFSYNFNGNFGPKNSVSTLKLSNKNFNIKLSVCEEKKQCTNVQILVSNDMTQEESSIQSLLILFDLREIGFPYEFELQSKNVRQGLKFQYMLDSSINSNNNLKYNLYANIQPTNAKVTLKLPSREILLEAKREYPQNSQIFGHYENSLAFYIDKTKKPHDVIRLLAQADITGTELVVLNANGLLKLEHPKIHPLTISGKLDANREHKSLNSEILIDIFKLPEQKVTITNRVQNVKSNNGFNVTSSHVVSSTGLGFEYTLNSHAGLNTQLYEFSSGVDFSLGKPDLKASAFIFGNREHGEILLYTFNEKLLEFVADFNKQKKLSKFNAKLQAMGKKPIEISAELQPTMTKLHLSHEGLLDVNSEIKLGKEVKFQAKSASKELIIGRVGLDASNFLRTSYNTNEENINEFMNNLEIEIKKETKVTEEVKKRAEELKEIYGGQLELLKDSVPDFSQFTTNYHDNLNEIVKELEADPAMKEISEAIQYVYRKFWKLAEELTKLWSHTYEKMHQSFSALYEKLQSFLKEVFIPTWEALSANVSKILHELGLEIVNLYSKTFKSMLELFKQYEPALTSYGKIMVDVLKPFNEAIEELYKALLVSLEEVVNEWIEYWSKLPSFDVIQNEIKQKLQRLQLAEKSIEFVNNAFDKLHILPLTSEISEFLQKLHEYVVATLKHQPVDDEKLVEELIKLFMKAMRSIWTSLEIPAPTGASFTSFSLNDLFTATPLPIDLVDKLPNLLSVRFSVINFILNEDWEKWIAKENWKPLLYFKGFDLKGHIVDGRHVFTYDGQHIKFSGNCKYILAQDSVDNNFTVIAQINNEKMKSVYLIDREGQYMEINDGGVLKLNGNAVEYPQHENGMHAWRLYYTVHMVSEYGVHVTCTSDLVICHIDVDGFYTSKMRGLLGNGNAEQYDDFIQIDGSVAGDSATFVNGYGLGKCNPATVEIQVDEANLQRSDICNELFGYESTLSVGYFLIDSKPYRNACDQSVLTVPEKDKETSACTIAMSYASALKLENIFVFLPKRCLKCHGQVGQREIGDEFTVKVPTNKADIVFVVDIEITPTLMKNLVAPVVTEVRETLKSRGFTDVQIGVVAYSANQRYPAILTSDNGKINYQGNLADIKLNGPKPIFESSISQMITEKKVLDVFDLLEGIVKSIVPQSDEMAFRLALNYPFRAGAAKSIVAVRSNNLEYDNMFKFVRAHLIGAVTQFDAALLHVLAPVKEMSLEGIPNEKIVGFNSRLVATLDGKDSKKRTKLQFHNDMGIDFVLNNGGWVFATQNIEQLKPQEQKKALNQITTSLADTLFKTEIVSDCRCLPVHGIHAQHKCVIKTSNFIPNKKVKA